MYVLKVDEIVNEYLVSQQFKLPSIEREIFTGLLSTEDKILHIEKNLSNVIDSPYRVFCGNYFEVHTQ